MVMRRGFGGGHSLVEKGFEVGLEVLEGLFEEEELACVVGGDYLGKKVREVGKVLML
jgi:hypothetical protein